MTKEQRETLESYVRVTAITGPPSKVSVAIRACLDRLTAAERVVEAARDILDPDVHSDLASAIADYDKETKE